ncbi:hypothetical protein FEI13_08595 [Halomonas urmiana]|uniref:Uncharacterized protein n=1 Tax=Halomonas urmiana TaxID=490901 RepID=A0A5R8MHL8_9GAMM|nr:hypothetical protein [Halomonas urmiana]TLF50728.1 hypothetical protein FEI13_08595 [Halomonas urmiana]
MPRDDGRFDAFDHADRVKEGRAFQLLEQLRDGPREVGDDRPPHHRPPRHPLPHYPPPHHRRAPSTRDRFSVD